MKTFQNTSQPYPEEQAEKVFQMKRESWIKNVMRIYTEKTREETEQLFDKLFPDRFAFNKSNS